MTSGPPRIAVPEGYDPSGFPAFAVTVDVVILTMSEGTLHVLLVCRGEDPFRGMWAIPGGFKRPTETLDEAAKRELAEETGYTASDWLHLATLHLAIGYSNEHIEIYLARGLKQAKAKLDDEEFLEVFTLPLATALAWVREGRITDSKTVSSLFWAEKVLAGGWGAKR